MHHLYYLISDEAGDGHALLPGENNGGKSQQLSHPERKIGVPLLLPKHLPLQVVLQDIYVDFWPEGGFSEVRERL